MENGAWDDGTAENKVVTLNGYEGDTLKLDAKDIPAVGAKPAEGYEAGIWDPVPDAETAISEDTTYTYTYAKKEEPQPRPKPAGRDRPVVRTKGKTQIVVSWTKMENVDGYDVFLVECSRENEPDDHLYKSVSAKKNSLTIRGLKKGKTYKLRVKAYVKKNGKKYYYGDKYTMHVIVGGVKGDYTNVVEITPKKTQLKLTVGQEKEAEVTLTGEVKGKKPLAHGGGALSYRSSNPAVATVDKNGVVKGMRAGTCTIEIRANSGVTASVKIRVTKGPKTLSFPEKKYTLTRKQGQNTLDLKALLGFTPPDATLVLTWTSSAPKVASVNKKGVVTARRKGSAVITVEAANGKKAKVKIVVK